MEGGDSGGECLRAAPETGPLNSSDTPTVSLIRFMEAGPELATP